MHQISTRLMNWASILEETTQEQALRTSQMPFVFPHVALMPDAQLGLGATVGSVIPTERAVMPAAVGVDIGCGMIAVLTQFTEADLEGRSLSPLRQSIERAIPLSAGAANRKVVDTAQPRVEELEAMAASAEFSPDQRAGRWRLQLGSLGSGNHFVEISLDEQDRVWAFLHSGSRGVGNKIAQHHIAVARQLMDRYWIDLPDRDLAYLVEGTDEFWSYLRELRWAQHYALLNRDEMMDRVLRQLGEFLGSPVVEHERVNCHHNFTQQEQHWGKQLWVSRKGAIEAKEGQLGLIPGSRAPGRTSSRGSATPSPSTRPRTGRGGSTAGTRPGSGSPTSSSGRPCRASSSGTPRRSWMRSPAPTRTSTRSWLTLPIW